VTRTSKSARRNRRAIGGDRVIPAQAGIQRRATKPTSLGPRLRANDWLLPAMRRLNWVIYRVLQVALTVLIAVMLIPVTLQIFSRFFEFIPRYIWTEEVARFCLMWLIMLGATIAVRDGTHFDVDVLPTPKTNHGKAVARLIVHVPILMVALVFIAFGWRFARFGYEQSSEMTGINMLSIHIAWPLAGICWLLFLAEKIIDDVKLYRSARRGAR
jgi:TRAP-type C4-dicarboxylate transport system permease small subunit